MDKRQATEFLGYLLRDKSIERTIYEDALKIAIESLKAQLSKENTTKDAISRQAAIDAIMGEYPEVHYPDWYVSIIKELPTVQPEPSIPLSWIEKHIEWLKSIDNEFAKLVVGYISIMLKKLRDEQDETD